MRRLAPTAAGALLFSDPESAIEGLREIRGNCAHHAKAALATEHFKAAAVVGCMLEEAGFR